MTARDQTIIPAAGLLPAPAGFIPIHLCGYGYYRGASGRWAFLLNVKTMAVLFERTQGGEVAEGNARPGVVGAHADEADVPAEVRARFAPVLDAWRARAAILVKGARVEFAHNGKTVVGTVQRVNPKTVKVTADDGMEYTCPPHVLRPTAVAAPAALPQHPTMARWSLGKVRYGLVCREGRSWEQPLLLDGKKVGMLRDDASGGSVNIDAPHGVAKQFCADASAWAAAVGDPGLVEAYSCWASWETDDRPFGRPYKTLKQRFG